MAKPNPNNSLLRARRVLAKYSCFPRSQEAMKEIIDIYYPGDAIHEKPKKWMSEEQVYSFSRRLYHKALNLTLRRLSPIEEGVLQMAKEAEGKVADESERETLAERVAIILEGNNVPDNSPVMPDVDRIIFSNLPLPRAEPKIYQAPKRQVQGSLLSQLRYL